VTVGVANQVRGTPLLGQRLIDDELVFRKPAPVLCFRDVAARAAAEQAALRRADPRRARPYGRGRNATVSFAPSVATDRLVFRGRGFHVTAGVGGVMASVICSCLAWLLVMGVGCNWARRGREAASAT
jgi:hypothetical protein